MKVVDEKVVVDRGRRNVRWRGKSYCTWNGSSRIWIHLELTLKVLQICEFLLKVRMWCYGCCVLTCTIRSVGQLLPSNEGNSVHYLDSFSLNWLWNHWMREIMFSFLWNNLSWMHIDSRMKVEDLGFRFNYNFFLKPGMWYYRCWFLICPKGRSDTCKLGLNITTTQWGTSLNYLDSLSLHWLIYC